ncbi:ribosome maturation factor RimP [Ekhidna sp.]|uniref:ribosome maturation factor RimP n=1 Tax=Ekhidna sp. TaxID=2608089 RepID=UPI003B514BCC
MLENRVRSIAEKAIENNDELFLVDVKIKGNPGNQKVLVFVDGDNGISIDQCSAISRFIGSELEECEILDGKYLLEVSSPGLDFPLSLSRQYVKNVGRELEIEMLDGEKIHGELTNVENEEILIKDKVERSLQIKDIKQSKVKVSFK